MQARFCCYFGGYKTSIMRFKPCGQPLCKKGQLKAAGKYFAFCMADALCILSDAMEII